MAKFLWNKSKWYLAGVVVISLLLGASPYLLAGFVVIGLLIDKLIDIF